MNAFNPRKPREYDWDGEPTPSLNLYLTALKAEPDLWNYITPKHRRNLFDDALQRLAPAEGLVDAVKDLRDELTREGHHPERGPVNIETRRITNRLNKIIHKWRSG